MKKLFGLLSHYAVRCAVDICIFHIFLSSHIMSHFLCVLSPHISSSVSLMKDEMLIQAVGRCGGGPGHPGFTWTRVTDARGGGMLGRTAGQCRYRWVHRLQPAALGEQPSKQAVASWSVAEVSLISLLLCRAVPCSEARVANIVLCFACVVFCDFICYAIRNLIMQHHTVIGVCLRCRRSFYWSLSADLCAWTIREKCSGKGSLNSSVECDHPRSVNLSIIKYDRRKDIRH